MATFLRKFPAKLQVYSLEGATKVRLSAKVVEEVREKIREGSGPEREPTSFLERRPSSQRSQRRVSLTPAVAASGTARAVPPPRRRASKASLWPFAARASLFPLGRAAQPKRTAPAAKFVRCTRLVAASAQPKPPAASSSTPEPIGQTTHRKLKGLVARLADDRRPEKPTSPEPIGQTTRRKLTGLAARLADDLRPGESASPEPIGQTTHRKLTGLSSCPRAVVVQDGPYHPVYIRSGSKAARSMAYVANGIRKRIEQVGTISSPRTGQGPRQPRHRSERSALARQPGRFARRADEK